MCKSARVLIDESGHRTAAKNKLLLIKLKSKQEEEEEKKSYKIN